MDDGRVDLEIAGERLVLLPERAIWWSAERVVFVTDVHLGRLATLRARGTPVPGGTLDTLLARLGRIVELWAPEQLIVLGDLVEHADGLTRRVVDRVATAIAGWSCELVLVPGNHDRRAGRLPEVWPHTVREPGTTAGPFVLRHEPEPTEAGYVLAGHYHPTIRLEGGGDRLRLPCFAFGDEVGLLPAFHPMTNGVAVSRTDHRIFAVADGEVVDLQG